MMRTWMKRVALWMVVCLPVLAVAQQGTVRGFLYEQETGEPAIFTPVTLKGANDLRLKIQDAQQRDVVIVPAG